jgi:hypothetical protein
MGRTAAGRWPTARFEGVRRAAEVQCGHPRGVTGDMCTLAASLLQASDYKLAMAYSEKHTCERHSATSHYGLTAYR